MPSYDVLEDYNSYHGIQTTFGTGGMPYKKCETCNDSSACRKLAPWKKICEPVQDGNPGSEKESNNGNSEKGQA